MLGANSAFCSDFHFDLHTKQSKYIYCPSNTCWGGGAGKWEENMVAMSNTSIATDISQCSTCYID